MVKLVYGSQKQVEFKTLSDYYFAMGFIANSHNAEIRWENNEDQGAWGSEGRIHCLVPQSYFPQFFRFTAGRGNVYARINCNEYVANLVQHHNFNYNTKYQDIKKILSTVPAEYYKSFQDGYGSSINFASMEKTDAKNEMLDKDQCPKSNTQTDSTTSLPSKKTSMSRIDIKIGEQLEHKSFGIGKVYEIDRSYIRVEFDSVGKKSFVNPDSFNGGFLKKI